MKHIFIISAFLLMALTAGATHNRSGEILYKRVAPFSNTNGPVFTYSITVIRYTDHGVSTADRCIDTVYFGDGQKAAVPRMNGGTTLNCGCGGGTIQCGAIIVSQANYIVKKNVYSVIHTYPGVGSYLVSSSDPNRNGGIHNIPNSSSVPFYIDALLVISVGLTANNSPVFTSDPINQATLGVCFIDVLGATDADGDSLSYELIPCAMAPGYFYPEIPGSGSLTLDQSGTFTWCHPLYVAEYQVVYKVSEWRKNNSGTYVLIGYVMRDRQILVNPGPVGLGEELLGGKIKLYPNPVLSTLKIDLEEKSGQTLIYKIYSCTGEMVFESNVLTVSKTLGLDLSAIERGIYTLRLESDGKSRNIKFLKN